MNMPSHFRLPIPTLTAVLLLVACGDDGGDDAQPQDDVTGADSGTQNDTSDDEDDVATVGDVSAPPDAAEGVCFEADLIDAWPLHDDLADESVTTVADGDAFVTTIDASAGGSQVARENPFVYFDFASGEQFFQTDIESLADTDWVLGFRRTNIRLNSGDSGPGAWEMARVGDTTFDAVTSVPGEAIWEVDATFGPECEIVLDPIGNPFTAINYLNSFNPSGSASWYDYGEGGVSPIPTDVYVVRNTETDAAWKFAIEAWDDGVYTIRWSGLAP